MRWTLPLLLAVAVPAAGCGDDEPAPPAPRVQVAVATPVDATAVDSETVVLEGSVVPARAAVQVRGEQVRTSGGRFSTSVELEPGANVIDVSASASGRRPDVAAIRVVRRMPVQVPSLQGETVEAAVAQLQALGLRADVRRVGGLLDEILGGRVEVCGTDPGEGETVRPATTVTVEASRGC